MRFHTRRLVVAEGALVCVALVACSSGSRQAPPPPAPAPAGTSASPSPTAPATHPFTGGTRGLHNPVLAVKIDNTHSAHPQLGLRSADIVYVEQVEGGVTRIMAVFSSKLPARVGPVRSARISDLHILHQFGRPALAYSGVQSKMKPYVRRAPLYDVSPDHAGGAYYRAGGRPAPYNLFATTKALLARAPKTGKPRDIGFRFGPAPDGGKRTSRFTARWPSGTMSFRWSSRQKRWLAYYDGRADKAAEGGQLGAPTVVVQYAKTTRSRFHDFLGNYTPLVQTVGTGRAVVLRDGKSYAAKWSRPSEGKGTTFTTTSGAPMTFATGQVWVVLVNKGKPRVP
ncbi:MAG TPA: DUF3048 domain-containing protein [Streptosporangiaceae bacterium]|nr:DUF3048 domain-containing protein [Streptosporangiaceae bacterium]